MRHAEHLQVRDWPRLVGVMLVAMSLGLLGALLAQAPVQAHDHQIPRTALKKGAKGLQAGILVGESWWVSPAGIS